MTNKTFNGFDRGVSPVVGVVILMGFVVFVGVGLFIFAQTVIITDDPRVDADFELEFTDTNSFNLNYVNGEPFTSDDTHELYVIGENPGGERIDRVMIYEEGDVKTQTGRVSELTAGMTALTDEDVIIPESQNDTLESGASLQVVWESESDPGTQIVIDEIVFPDESTIEQRVVADGQIGVDVDINIGIED